MSPRNVLILVDKFDYHGSWINGPSRYFSWVAERLDPERFRPFVCTLRGRGRSDAVFAERGIEVRYLELGRFDPRALARVIRLVRELEIDLIHLVGYASTTFGRIAGRWCRVPVIVQEHWVDPEMSALHSLFERAMTLFPARGIAISEYARRFLIEKKHLRPEDVTVIRNGVPIEPFRRAGEAEARKRRAELGLPETAPLVGIVGMLHANKGHRDFLEAAARSRRDALFVVVGDGEERGALEEQARALGIGERVRFLGHQSEMPAVLRMLDVFVVASISEAAGLSLLEAMATGRAIVTTDSGGPGEIVEHERTGLVVPVRDPGALAAAIDALLEDPGRRDALGRRAREASERFDIRHTVAALEAFYEDVAS